MDAPKRVLLVDDDPDFLEINRNILEAAGHAVACASDPAAAMQEMARAAPDLVIADLMMVDLDSGFSLARRIKGDARFRAVPVIILTAASSQRGFDFAPRSPEDLAAMCADAYFDKPVAPEVLLAKVRELLAR